ncbi:MAG: hypothetical protein ACR2L0_02955 [Gaiellaceae bacterium]
MSSGRAIGFPAAPKTLDQIKTEVQDLLGRHFAGRNSVTGSMWAAGGGRSSHCLTRFT